MKRNRWRTADLTKMALLVALLSVSSYISIPLPFTAVTLTTQTLIVNLIALVLTPGQTAAVIGTWILIGSAGLPVFSGGMGGVARLAGPTGGFIWGFMAAALLISLLKGKSYKFSRYCFLTIGVGIPVIDLFGAVFMKLVLQMSWGTVFVSSIVPFIPLDIVKGIAAAYMAKYVQKATKGMERKRLEE